MAAGDSTRFVFILSSIGGPKMLGSLLGAPLRDDVVYLVVQQMPSGEYMQGLVNCLCEDSPRRMEYLCKDAYLRPGTVYFLSSRLSYRFEGRSVQVAPPGDEQTRMPIDSLLRSALDQLSTAGIVVLSGIFLDRDGVEGVAAMKAAGVPVWASSKAETPVTQMIDELEKLALIDAFHPHSTLLGELHRDWEPAPAGSPVESEELWLVVDDEEEVREVIGTILGFEDIRCDYAVDGLDALRKIRKTNYAALVLDVKMPEMTGLQTLEALHTMEPHLPILMVTGFDDPETRAAALDKNVVGVLLKPFTGEDLRQFLPLLRQKGRAKDSGQPNLNSAGRAG